MADPLSVKMAKVDAEDWLNDETENASIDMWQAKIKKYLNINIWFYRLIQELI